MPELGEPAGAHGPGVTDAQLAPPGVPLRRYRRRLKASTAARELWQARSLVRRLAGRELRVRYRRAFLGFAWAVVTPVALMLTFTLVLARVTHINTGGAPYPLFAYLGLLPWAFFSTSVSTGSNSLLSNINLLQRAYLPREVFPLSTLLVSAVDFGLSACVLLVLFPLGGFAPRATSFWVPLYFAIQVLFTGGVVLVMAGAVIYIRDIRHVLTLALQVGLFATPVVYALTVIPQKFRLLYVVVNPLGAVIDGYRRAVLFGQGPDWPYVIASGTSALVVAAVGYWAFKKMEPGVADIS